MASPSDISVSDMLLWMPSIGMIATMIGSYFVVRYKASQHEEHLSKIDIRLDGMSNTLSRVDADRPRVDGLEGRMKELEKTAGEVVRLSGVNADELERLKDLKKLVETLDTKMDVLKDTMASMQTSLAVLEDRQAREDKA